MADASVALTETTYLALVGRIKTLSWVTLAWLAVDGAVGMTAGIAANSIVLIGWGLDCAIQSAAAVVLLWRFTGARVGSATAERSAQKVVAVSFFLLVPYILVTASNQLLTGDAATASWLGISLATIDATLMPSLGRMKLKIGARLSSSATTSEGRQNLLCAYLSVGVLLGLAANAVLGWWWADPSIAILVAVVAIQSGAATWGGRSC